MIRIEKIVEKIKKDILGKSYELSFAFIDKKEIKQLNKTYRKKNEATDILSFPLSKTSGEILICKEMADKKFKKFRLITPENFSKPDDYLLFLVIHGMLHLKGLKHGCKMNEYEFTYYSRYRCGNLRSKSRSNRTRN